MQNLHQTLHIDITMEMVDFRWCTAHLRQLGTNHPKICSFHVRSHFLSGVSGDLYSESQPRRKPQTTVAASANTGGAPSRRRRRVCGLWGRGSPSPWGWSLQRDCAPTQEILKFYRRRSSSLVHFHALLNYV